MCRGLLPWLGVNGIICSEYSGHLNSDSNSPILHIWVVCLRNTRGLLSQPLVLRMSKEKVQGDKEGGRDEAWVDCQGVVWSTHPLLLPISYHLLIFPKAQPVAFSPYYSHPCHLRCVELLNRPTTVEMWEVWWSCCCRLPHYRLHRERKLI